MTDNQLRLVTLGRLALELPAGRDDEGLNKQRRKLAVLAVLALARRPMSRDALVEMFWGGQSEDRARHSLSEALSHLRRVLGREAIATRQSEISLSLPHAPAVDALELSAAAAKSDDARVASLYEGPFLNAVHLDDAPSFERWVDGERGRLENLFVRAAERQALVLARGRRWTECGELARRWLDAVPLSVDAARYLINALKAPGTREADALALDAYDRLVNRLRSEYETDPDPTVAELAHSIRERLRSSPPLPLAAPAVAAAPAVPAPVEPPSATAAEASVPNVDAIRPLARSRGDRSRTWLIAAAVALILVTLATLLSRKTRDSVAEGDGLSTIAVIPFAHLSGDSSTLYLTEGVTDEVSAALGGVAGLRVMASPSVTTLREKKLSAKELGAALHADAVLEGTVRTAGDSARVTVRLIDTNEGVQLWVGRYDRTTRDVLAMQGEIADAVVAALRARGGVGLTRASTRPVDPRAHDFYLRARYLENRSGEANLRRAYEYYERAFHIDTSFAAAEAGMASATLNLMLWGSTYSEAAPNARRHAEAAIRLEPGTAEAHTVLARLLRNDWRWSEAEREFRVALASNPSDVTTWHSLSHLYMALGDMPRSRDATRRAVELDPLNPRMVMHECVHFDLARQVDSALASCRRGLELDPNFPDSHAKLAHVYMQAGRGAEAVSEVDREIAVSGATPTYRATRGLALASAGQPDSARATLGAIQRDTPGSRVPMVLFALVYAKLGDNAKAFSSLENAYAAHAIELEDVTTAPELDPIRSDPRFKSLLTRIGLPEVGGSKR